MVACWINISNARGNFPLLLHLECFLCSQPPGEPLFFFIEIFLCYFSLTAKSLVARLMEVDQDQRLTAQEAINHEW